MPVVSQQTSIWLNGELLHAQGEGWSTSHAVRDQPLLVEMAPALLRAGANELLVRVDHGRWRRAGLAPVEVGTWSALFTRHEGELGWRHDLPKTLNLFALAVASGLIIIWWRRRNEQAIGLLGVAHLFTSVRNYAYFGPLMLPPVMGDWALFSSVVVSTCLSFLFVLKFVDVAWPRLARACAHAAWVLPLVAASGAMVTPEWLAFMRGLIYPVVLVLTTTSHVLILRAAWLRRNVLMLILALSFTAVVVASVHDAVFILGKMALEDTYWLPYAAPLSLAAFAAVLVVRLFDAVQQVEQLTQHLEQRVAERTHELALAIAAKSRFLSAASHDLRQPLHAIGLLVGLVREHIRYPEVRSLVDKIQRSVDGMASLLKGLLDLTRLESTETQPRLEDIELAQLFRALQLAAAPEAAAKGLNLRFARSQAHVRSDRLLLHCILQNLLVNALRYTPHGKILVGARRRGTHLCLQVLDTGVGMSPGEQERVFDEFYRGPAAASTDTPGFGLGLSIVQQAAQRLGHDLRLHSQPGRGSCFEVLVPLAPGLARPLPAAPEVSTAVAQLGGAFVLVLEDDREVADALEALLLHWGCHVLSATSLETAQQHMQQHLREPDLLVCDLRLGTQDGLQAVRQLRAMLGDDVPALLITGAVAPDSLEAVRSCGLPVLFKPVQPKELQATLAALLSAR